MKREELKQHAQAHYADIKVRLKEETNRAIINSEIFGPNLPFSQKEEKTYHNTFYLKDQDSVSCLTDRSKAAVLRKKRLFAMKVTSILFFLLLMIHITHD